MPNTIRMKVDRDQLIKTLSSGTHNVSIFQTVSSGVDGRQNIETITVDSRTGSTYLEMQTETRAKE